MSDFNVTAPRLPGAVGTVSPTAVTGTVPDPPRNFAGMDNGTILRGTVQGRDKDGLVSIKTDQGILKVATTANLPAGSNVTLEVRAIGDRLQVMVLSVDAPGPLPLPQSPAPQPQLPQGQLPQGQSPAASGAQQPPLSSGGTVGGPGAGPATGADAGGKTPVSTPVESPSSTPVVVVAGSTLSAIVVQALPRDLLQRAATAQLTPRRGVDISTLPATPGSSTADAPEALGGTVGGTLGESFGGTSLIPQIRDKIALLFFGSTSAPAGLAAEGAEGGVTLTGLPGQGSGIATSGATGPGAGAAAGTALGSLSGELLADQTLTAPLATGTEVKLRVLAIQNQLGEILDFPGLTQADPNQSGLMQPGLSQSGLAALAGGGGKNVLLGQIIGQTPAGHPVIHTPVGDLVLHERILLPVGAKIMLALDLMETILPAVTPMLTPQGAAVNLARGWPTLADLLLTLLPGGDDDAPDAATQAAGRDIAAALAALPQPGNRLGLGLLSVMDAYRNGDFEKLFGPLSQALKTIGGKSDALRKLRDEFMQLSLLAQDGKSQDWRSFFLPLWDDGRLQQINLFYRRSRRDQSQDDKDGHATRFIVEVNFTRLGACQLDGLVKKKRFDLMVRSHLPLPESSRREIGNLFAQARELGNYAGDIHFQTTTRFPVSPLGEVATAPPSVVA
ncbi:MAG: hypothetical protein ABWY00_02405 [Dongiaceae bacterium]